jgi:hypothetical protein
MDETELDDPEELDPEFESENKSNTDDPDDLDELLLDPFESPKEKKIDTYVTRTITIIIITLGFANIPFT